MVKETYKLINAVKKMYPVTQFFKDRYFPDGKVYYSQKALIETKNKGRKVAPFVIPVVGGIAVEAEGYRAYEVDAPFIAPKMAITAEELELKGFGESPESGRSPADRANEVEAEHLDDLRQSILRRHEQMCTELITTGKMVMKHYANANDAANGTNYQTKELRFYDGSFGNVYTFGSNFKTASTQTRLQELYNIAGELRKRGVRATDIVMTSDVSKLLLTDKDFLEYYDKRFVATGVIDQKELPEGVVANGNININGVVFTMFTYDEYYEDLNGQVTEFLPKGTIAFLKPGMGETVYAQVTFVQGDGFKSYAEKIVPRLVTDEANNMQEVQTFSRPVPYPFDWDGWMIANINDHDADDPTFARLSSLSVGSLTLDPTFAKSATAYTTTTTNASETVTATGADGATVSIKVNGTAVTSGSSASLNAGSNTIVVKASKEGCYSTTYTITVTRTVAYAKLSALTIGSCTLTPSFDADVTEYTTTTTNASNTVTATGADSATVVIKNGDTTVTSGNSASWDEGENTLTVKVSKAGLEDRTYTVTVTRGE